MFLKILGLNHIGIAPKNLAQARWFFEEVLKLPFKGQEVVNSEKTNTFMYLSSESGVSSSVQETRLELLAAEPEDEGPIAKYLVNRGGGVHHIAITVDDIVAAYEHMRSFGVKMINARPKLGAHRTKVLFVHPHATGGFLVELVEESKS